MKKFLIFLLGIIVAVIGFHFFANKSEPTPDNPPINNEQPGDNNQTPNPSDPDDLIGVPQYTTNRFNLNNVQLLGLDKYNPQTGECISVDFSNGLDSVQLEIGSDYMFNLLPASGYAITEFIYDSSCFWSGYVTDSISGTFTAVENGVFSVTTQPVDNNQTPNPSDPDDVIGMPQYTTNTFNLGNSLAVDMYIYNSGTGSADCIWPLDTELDSYNFVVGEDYYLHLSAIDGYEITEVYYNSDLVYSGDACLTVAVSFHVVENGVFSVTTQAIQTEQTGYAANNLVECDAADYTFIFTDVNGNQVDTLYAGQDYAFEISIHETDRIVTFLESNFTSPSYPNSQTAGFTFNMYDVDANSSSIWVYTALTTETVNLVMGDTTGVSVNITTLEGITPETYYAGAKYMAEIVVDANYNLLGYSVNGESITFDAPICGENSTQIHFTLPSGVVGDVEFSLQIEYVGAE